MPAQAQTYSSLDSRLDDLEAGRGLTFPLEDYGAVAGQNVTVALTAAIAAATAAGGGLITMAPTGNTSRYLFTGEMSFPDRVGLWGAGPRTTYLEATSAASFLNFEGQGAISGNFTLTGADLADVGVRVGFCNQRIFMGLNIERADTLLLLDGTQNACFIGLKGIVCQVGVTFDNGAGGNVFVGHTELAQFTASAVKFVQSDTIVGGFADPAYNTFYGGMLEHVGTAGAITCVVDDVSGGYLNQFYDVLFSASAANTACSLIRSRDPAGYPDKRLRFNNCHFQGDLAGTYVTAFDLASSTNVELGGRCTFANTNRRFFMDDTSRVRVEQEPYLNSAGTYFVTNGGTLSANDLIRYGGTPRNLQLIATNVDVTLTAGTSGDQIIHTGTLTADRAVTLATSDVPAGAWLRITRTGTGAFNLNIGSGPLKALALNTWCEVVFNGSAWVLTAYGAL